MFSFFSGFFGRTTEEELEPEQCVEETVDDVVVPCRHLTVNSNQQKDTKLQIAAPLVPGPIPKTVKEIQNGTTEKQQTPPVPPITTKSPSINTLPPAPPTYLISKVPLNPKMIPNGTPPLKTTIPQKAKENTKNIKNVKMVELKNPAELNAAVIDDEDEQDEEEEEDDEEDEDDEVDIDSQATLMMHQTEILDLPFNEIMGTDIKPRSNDLNKYKSKEVVKSKHRIDNNKVKKRKSKAKPDKKQTEKDKAKIKKKSAKKDKTKKETPQKEKKKTKSKTTTKHGAKKERTEDKPDNINIQKKKSKVKVPDLS